MAGRSVERAPLSSVGSPSVWVGPMGELIQLVGAAQDPALAALVPFFGVKWLSRARGPSCHSFDVTN
jgi:hypothetical protein